MYENLSTHFVNIAYEYEMVENPDLLTKQHSEYKWFTINELLESKQLHKYV
jgi:colanic acid biosynthesis protein WcaH